MTLRALRRLLPDRTRSPAVPLSADRLCPELRAAPEDAVARTPAGCEECLELGASWVHLRLCLACGHVGCCDTGDLRHATAHARESGHPVMRSFEPGERWRWCYLHEQLG